MNNTANTIYWEVWDSPFGNVTVCSSEKGIRHLALGSSPKAIASGNGAKEARKARAAGRRLKMPEMPQWIRAGSSRQPGAKMTRRAIAELREYSHGRRKRFTVPLDLEGTPFQLKVWTALQSIPYGETRSYRQIACQVGNPLASRAVGMANHWNPVAIIVPCHRVISSDGSLGGYGGGLEKKVQMLRLEKSGVV